MKKFFKKISLVLAFALVAGSFENVNTAKAAETWKFQSSAETLYLGSQTVGADTFDFNFAGAPAGYATANSFAWSSSDTKVAEVATGGIVTAKANGTANITCRVTNKTTGLLTATATAKVTVRTITHATKVEIYDAKDTTKAAITSAKLVVGNTIDLNRQLTNAAGVVSAAGQATNTASTDKTAFKSSDASIASVDPSTGVVTALKAGKAVITAYTYDVTDANKTPIVTANVTVDVAADATYTAKQTAVDAFTITFVNDVAFDANKLQVIKIFEQDDVKEEINTYVKKTKQTGKEVLVTLYFEFDPEVTEYKVIYDGLEQRFMASIGKAVNVVIESTLADDSLYIYNSDIVPSASTDIKVYPVDANGIDVSNQYTDLNFNLEATDEMASIGEASKSENTASITVGEEAADGQTIVVTGLFAVDPDTEEDDIAFTKIFYAKKAPTQRIVKSAGAYIDGDAEDKAYDHKNWSDPSLLSIALDDETDSDPKYLHVKLVDNYGQFAFTKDTSNGEIKFASANPDKLLVDETTNVIKTIATGSAIPVVVYWTSPATSTTQRAKAVAIVPVTITLKRTVTTVSSSVGTPIMSNTATGVVTGANTSKITITLLDNYKSKIDATDKVIAYARDNSCKINVESPLEFTRKEAGVYEATLTDANFSLATGTQSKTFNFTVSVDGKTYSSASFSVKVADPTKGSDGVLVTASPVDVTVNKKLTGSMVGADDTDTLASTIEVFKTKNGVKLSKFSNVYPYINQKTSQGVLDRVSGTVSTNQVYFYEVVLGSNVIAEKAYESDGNDTNDKFVVVSAGKAVGTAVVRDALDAGNYTVRLYRAGSSTKDSNKVSKISGAGSSATLVVKNESGVLSYEATGAELTTADPDQAILQLFTFKYSDSINNDYATLNTIGTAAQFHVVSKEVGEYVYIESVTVTYQPATGVSEAVQKKFDINKTFPVVIEE